MNIIQYTYQKFLMNNLIIFHFDGSSRLKLGNVMMTAMLVLAIASFGLLTTRQHGFDW